MVGITGSTLQPAVCVDRRWPSLQHRLHSSPVRPDCTDGRRPSELWHPTSERGSGDEPGAGTEMGERTGLCVGASTLPGGAHARGHARAECKDQDAVTMARTAALRAPYRGAEAPFLGEVIMVLRHRALRRTVMSSIRQTGYRRQSSFPARQQASCAQFLRFHQQTPRDSSLCARPCTWRSPQLYGVGPH